MRGSRTSASGCSACDNTLRFRSCEMVKHPQERGEDDDGELQMSPAGNGAEERQDEGEIREDSQRWEWRLVLQKPIGEKKQGGREHENVIDEQVRAGKDCGDGQRRKAQ